MNGKKIGYLGLVFLSLFIVGCAVGSFKNDGDSTDSLRGNELTGFADFVEALETSGAAVIGAEDIEQPFFGVRGRRLQVDSVDIQVFEYEDEAAREADSSLISADGTSVGTTMITWVAPPHFWVEGRLIVLYVGTDQATLEVLNSLLGKPLGS